MEDPIIQQSIELAERWQTQSNRIKTRREAAFDEKIAKMVRNPVNKIFLTELIDQSFRPSEAKRIADQLAYLLSKYDDVDLFSTYENYLIEAFLKAGKRFPSVSVPAIINRIRNETSDVILEGEPAALRKHIKRRQSEKLGVNLNIIGEALLGEKEAERRIRIYQEALALPEVTYISIKISTIYSQITPLAFQGTLEALEEKLTRLFRSAMEHSYRDEDGKQRAKFINLDMEEYRDLALTLEAFKRTLSRPEFKSLTAGIVLQAYLPDALSCQRDLTEWAQSRVAEGGVPIKLRIVKGANMDMEKTEASMRHWPQAPYHSKLDTDANYKRMLRFALAPERAACVKLGIASHNLFELAHAHLLAQSMGSTEHIVFEMLEGMADATARTVHADGVPVLLYAPVATKENFTHAIAYYVRRLDENTSPQNFLTHSFKLTPGDEDWNFLAEQFKASFDRIDTAPDRPFRAQSRLDEANRRSESTYGNDRFSPEPDTDWTLRPNRIWARSIVDKWRRSSSESIEKIPVVVGSRDIYEGQETHEVIDQSQYERKIPIARYALATVEQVEQAVAIAKSDDSGWSALSQDERHRILSAAAEELRHARGDLIGVAAAEVGKIFSETDVEVSEAIDFAEFYPFATRQFAERPNIKMKAKGVGVVIPPWNFPIAIPAGGVLASLAAGNNTILKPSPQAVYCSWIICQALWKAGVPRRALQFLPCRNDPEATRLASHPDVAFVIFTGSTKTALSMLKRRARLHIYAETGGKNATVVSSVSDRDKVIADVVQSAFSNTGQKCSATSLLLLHRPLFEDRSFREALVDAAASLPTGYAWDLKTKLGPLANPVGGPLKESLTKLLPKEEWALEPKTSPTNPHVLTPGILWNVSQKSYCYLNELFGPVLGVMPYDTMDEAIRLVNETDYGLTSGLQSLDEREIAQWREAIRAGNLYINRGTTGAIVLRQPFGGMAKSAIGPGIKVGGWDYTLEFAETEEIGLPEHRAYNDPRLAPFETLIESYPDRIDDEIREQLQAAFESSIYEYENVFSQTEDYFKIRGETNQSRYLKMREILVRVEPADSAFSILSRLFNTRLAKSKLIISVAPELPEALKGWLKLTAPELEAEYREEDQDALCRCITKVERMRFATPEAVSEELCEEAAKHGLYIAASPPLIDGRLELVLYFREQSISHTFHRYGNLGQRQLDSHEDELKTPGNPAVAMEEASSKK